MEHTQDMQRKLQIAGAIFGVVLGAVLAWSVYIAPAFALRDIPIDPASFNLDSGAILAATAICIVGAGVGAFLVACLWQRPGLGLLCGALATALVRTIPAYLVTVATVENQRFGAYIMFQLPFAIIFGAILSFLGGLLGSAAERLILSQAARLLRGARWATALGWLLVVGGGGLLGYIGGGHSARTDESIAAAQAVNRAIQIAAGRAPAAAPPPNFLVSAPALATLRGLGPRIQQPYRISLGGHDGSEVATDARFQDGLAVRCVSRAARISRCFEQP